MVISRWDTVYRIHCWKWSQQSKLTLWFSALQFMEERKWNKCEVKKNKKNKINFTVALWLLCAHQHSGLQTLNIRWRLKDGWWGVLFKAEETLQIWCSYAFLQFKDLVWNDRWNESDLLNVQALFALHKCLSAICLGDEQSASLLSSLTTLIASLHATGICFF